MKNRNSLLILAGLLFVFQISFGQETDSIAPVTAKKERKVSIIPLPVIGANPTMGIVYGVAPAFNWTMGNPATTNMSSYLATFLFTTKNQRLFQLRGNMFTSGNEWMMITDLRFILNSQPTYGLGTDPRDSDHVVEDPSYPPVSDDLINGPPENEMMYFDHFRLYQTFLKRYKNTPLYYGLGYHLDVMSNIEDKLLNLDTNPQVLTYHYQYQTKIGMPLEGYTQSGVSINASFDKRDNVANPYEGELIYAALRINPSFLGSTESSSQLWLEYRDYFTLNKNRPRNLLAFWAYGWFVTGGKVPYMFLPATGWDMFGRSARPHTFGRFRGEDLVYTELEWRFPLQKTKDRWGGVVFVNATTASSRTEDVSLFSYFGAGYGAGLRFMLLPKKKVNICLDYGRGVHGASAIFFGLNEVF